MRTLDKLNRRGLIALLSAAIAVPHSAAAMAQEATVSVLRSATGAFQHLYIAQEQGYMKEVGLNLDIRIGGSSPQMVAELVSGNVNLIMGGAVPLVVAVSKGVPLVATFNIQNQGEIPTTGVLVPPGSPIRSVADLVGRTVGVQSPHTIMELMLKKSLVREGLDANSVKLVFLPTESLIESAVNGSIDAVMPTGLFTSLAEDQGFTHLPGVYHEIQGMPATSFLASKKFVDENGDVLRKFNQALQKAYDYANKNRDAVRDVDRKYTRLPEDYITKRYIAPMEGGFNRDRYQQLIADMKKFGFIDQEPALTDVLWADAP